MIYTGLNRTGEIEQVYAHGGSEVSEVYGSIGEAEPIYYKQQTITGTSPLTFKGLGNQLKDYLISGNTIQDGTPTPDMPVDVVGCGDIWNNWNGTLVRYRLGKVSGENKVSSLENGAMFQIKATPNVDYTVEQDSSPATSLLRIYRSNNPLAEGLRITYDSMVEWNGTGTPKATINSGSFKYIWIQFGGTWYDSYGVSATISLVGDYVIPLTVNGTEYPIYLGQVPTTRRTKKLVLTGEEAWNLWPSGQTDVERYYYKWGKTAPSDYGLICTHLPFRKGDGNFEHIRLGGNYSDDFVVFISRTIAQTVADFKSYLAAQYAAGTPVTAWYVLAEPETGIVNEPLHKIGDYADTISFAQSSVTIPTIAGSNTFAVGTDVQPSAVSITGNIKPT